jgi:ubiquinone/menaquinone biosynthesis C-methylase UbiE
MARFDYDRGDTHRVYDEARRLPEATLRLWLEALSRHVPIDRVAMIADVGCGTGRFAAGLAAHFGATVCGIDPAGKMLSVARQQSAANALLLRGRAEALPVRDAAMDLVFLSMVYHHLEDRRAAVGEFRRLLAPGGRLAIRTALRERLDTYLWLRFFPAARPIEFGRTPSSEELVRQARAGGFALQAHDVVRHPFAATLVEYGEKIGRRGLSSLQAIPDEEFERGVERLRHWCNKHEMGDPVFEEIDLFVFEAR